MSERLAAESHAEALSLIHDLMLYLSVHPLTRSPVEPLPLSAHQPVEKNRL